MNLRSKAGRLRLRQRHEGAIIPTGAHKSGLCLILFDLEVPTPGSLSTENLEMLSALSLRSSRNIAGSVRRRLARQISLKADGYPVDFAFYPNFFSVSEQRVLLSAALQKLDMGESARTRRRQRGFARPDPSTASVEDLSLPDDYYTFEEVGYPGNEHDAAAKVAIGSFRWRHNTISRNARVFMAGRSS